MINNIVMLVVGSNRTNKNMITQLVWKMLSIFNFNFNFFIFWVEVIKIVVYILLSIIKTKAQHNIFSKKKKKTKAQHGKMEEFGLKFA